MSKGKISIIGAGTMGHGIAQVAAQAGYPVLLYDIERERAEKGLRTIKIYLDKLAHKGKLEKDTAEKISERILIATELDEVADSYFLIEAIREDRVEKIKLFKECDALCGEHAVMASNTSSIPITDIASGTNHPENVIGMHFMNPVPLMPGVEIIRGLKTSDETYGKTIKLAEDLSKKPIHSSDKAGFVINRIMMPLINEAIGIVEEGTSTIEDVDNGAIYCLNHSLGPLTLSDLIGNDTTHHILSVLHGELGERFKPAPLLTRMVEAGLLGNKTGAGFYIWQDNKPKEMNKELSGYLK
ncbi:hypothetical protein UR09_01250 [Candidatus Nitromaritima sp. SCGC AAA799-A02]|nr:hypothetical protein UZ36_04065 [Candidatus Nitromaritima sp. SCGC AAA799-C22]KMP12386.1 hypothetical protein UR09_01250 [Candidatus Nitromaritima sp. SCGC AAA799-A02]